MTTLLDEICVNGREISASHPPYIIAEMSANHNGSLDKALQIVEVAAAMGADAIKLQTYSPDSMTIDCRNDEFQIQGGLWDGYSLYELYEQAHTPLSWHKPIFDHARKHGITCFSSPFDEDAVDLLEELHAPAYKIASFEIVDLPLIRYVAKTGKPMIISTGMANIEEIENAVKTAQNHGCNELVLMHCISGYPTPVEQSNLVVLNDLSKRFNVLVGLSDHTLGVNVSIASVALGACVIEKHFTLDRADDGPDSIFSIQPNELKRLCSGTTEAWRALGEVGYDQKPIEIANVRFRRSIYIVENMKAGDRLTTNNIRRIRPGFGLAPKFYDEVIGKIVVVDLPKGTALRFEHVEK